MSHYAATRLELVRTETLKRKRKVTDYKGEVKEKEIPTGHRVLMRVQKEQTGGAFEGDQTTFVFDYELGGIDPIEDLIYIGLQYGLVVVRNNKWFVVGYEEDKQNGRPAFKRWLRDNTEAAADLLESINNSDGSDDE